MVKRRHSEDALAVGHFEPANLKDNGKGLQHKYSAHYGKKNFLFRKYRECAKGAAQGERAHVSHKYLCGVGIVPEKAKAGPHCGAAQYGKLPRTCDIGDLQVACNPHVAGKVGKEKIRHETCNRRTNGKAVEAVCQVYRVGGADDYKCREYYISPSNIGQRRLEKGNRHIGSETRLDIENGADKQCYGDFACESHFSWNSPAVLACEFLIVIHESYESIADDDHDNKPDVIDRQVSPEEGGNDDRENDKDASHGRSSLFRKMCVRSIVPYGLADLQGLEFPDQPGTDDKGDQQCRNRSIYSSERDVPKDIEIGEFVVQGV